MNEFVALLGGDNGTEGTRAHTVPPDTLAFVTPVHKLSLNMKGGQRAHRRHSSRPEASITLLPSPIV